MTNIRRCLAIWVGMFALLTVVAGAVWVGDVAGQGNAIDYDADDDGLIEVSNLAQLNAIRWDLDGDGSVDESADSAGYTSAFPNAASGMGCPSDGCDGYELNADLDFDTNEDGRTDITGDTYWNNGKGWNPIGVKFSAIFDGNTRGIANLYIKDDQTSETATAAGYTRHGLFAKIDYEGEVRNVVLTGVAIAVGSSQDNDPNVTRAYAGALAGRNDGSIVNARSSGAVTIAGDQDNAGGLVGENYGSISASRSDATVTGTSTDQTVQGGLVGFNETGNVTGSYATGDVTGSGMHSLVGGLVGDNTGTISRSFATGSATTVGDDARFSRVGGLVGSSSGEITQAYATGAVNVSSNNSHGGGLVGENSGSISIAYATGDVTETQNDTSNRVAGFVATNSGSISDAYSTGNVTLKLDGQPSAGFVAYHSGSITNSYSTGSVKREFQISDPANVGGFVATATASATVTASYWDTTKSELTVSAAGTGKTTTELQSPTSATGIYAAWNAQIWNFGISSVYPNIDLRGPDHDADDDGLIDVSTLAQLNAIRLDPDGDGNGAEGYRAVFSGFPLDLLCPNSECKGYELTADIDLTETADDRWERGVGWQPIGTRARPFDATFQGNGHTITGLNISITTRSALNAGLFGTTGGDSDIKNVNLSDPNVYVYGTNEHGHYGNAGALVGFNHGDISQSSAIGGTITGSETAGGLVGRNRGDVTRSYSAGVVHSAKAAGGLAGKNYGAIVESYSFGSAICTGGTWYSGGLVARNFGSIKDSYTGTVPRGCREGHLVSQADGTTQDSYWFRHSSAIPQTDANTQGTGLLQGQISVVATPNWNEHDTVWDLMTIGALPALVVDQNGDGNATLAEFGNQRNYDHDADGDGLLEVTNLAQLNAIRWDLDGDGENADPDGLRQLRQQFWLNSTSGFTRMGCPSEGCTGYELAADLDFDTNGDGQMNANDAYWDGGSGWAPIGDASDPYVADFEGNGRAIRHLYVRLALGGDHDGALVGLFGQISGGSVQNVALLDVDVSGNNDSGAIVGTLVRGSIRNSYSTGTVVTTGENGEAGGLAGRVDGKPSDADSIADSYSLATVNASNDTAYAGGLVGSLGESGGAPASVRNSFAAGPVQASVSTRAGGLVGKVASNLTTATASYWDTESSGQSASAAGAGKTTAELQGPTNNTGIFADWSLARWDFDGTLQYPALKYDTDGDGKATSGEFGDQRIDYDADDDGLIEVASLDQLNAMRWDLNGDGAVDAPAVESHYLAAFPEREERMGCPSSGCVGYELTTGLDFDTNDNGRADSGDAHWNGGAGWSPIGSYSGVLDGNGHAIANLYINRAERGRSGLFSRLTDGAVARNLALLDVNITSNGDAGAFAGLTTRAAISNSYATGTVLVRSNNDSVGGFVGEASGHPSGHDTIRDSYSLVRVAATGYKTRIGGLVGSMHVNQSSHTRIVNSFAAGAVQAHDPTWAGGLVGKAGIPESRITRSYWDTQATGWTTSSDDGDGNADDGVGKSRQELQSPTSATGIYANWNSAAWDFGSATQYPALKFDTNGDGVATVAEFGSQPRTAKDFVADIDLDDDGLIEVSTLGQLNAIRWDPEGDGSSASNKEGDYRQAFAAWNNGAAVACVGASCVGYELTADLNFDTNDNGRADSGDAYWNGGAGWDPIGGYSGILDGSGHAIKNLHINRQGSDAAGLFGQLTNEAEVRNLGLTDVDITSGGDAGAFAGRLTDAGIIRSYATGTVTGHGDDASVGGLVGKASGHASRKGAIRDSYSLVAVTVSGDDTTAGGLAGTLSASDNSEPWIVHSFAAGPIQAVEPDLAGGLVGDAETDFAWVSHSYWDRETTGWDTSAVGGRETQDRLQAPKTTRNIFARWGSSIWDFGDHSQYPALKYDTNGDNVATVAEFGDQTRTATIPAIDLDWDNDGLIEINGANNGEIKAKLNAIRWDLNGDGTPSSNADDYWDAFAGGSSSNMPCVGVPCRGYELAGDVNLNQELWDPIGNLESGKWDATFRGNGYTVSHLNALSSSGKNTGLFGETTHRSVIEGVHIYSADVESYGGNNDDNRQNSAGALVGFNRGIVRESGLSYIWGDICSISGRNVSGGLVGGNEGIVERSWARCHDVNSKKGGGGLVGFNHPGGIVRDSWADGLVIVDRKGWKKGALIGRNFGLVEQSFSLGETRRGDDTSHGPLTGQQGGTVTDSYFVGHDYDEKYGGKARTDEEMRTPRPSEPSFFAPWDLDLWDLGDETQYSVLRADTDEDGYKTTWEIGSQRPSDPFAHEPAFVDGNAAHNIWREGLSLRFRKADGDANIRVDGIGYRIAQKGEACHEWVAGGRVMVGETNGRATLSEGNGVYTLVLDRADLWAFRPNGRVCIDVNFINTTGKKSDARRYRDIQMPGGEVPRSKPIKKAEAIISDGSVALWFDTNSYDWVKGVGYRVAITGDACESWEVGEGSFKPGDEIGGAVLTEVNGLWRLALPVGEGYIMEPNRRYCVDVTAFNDDGWADTGRRWRSFVTGD